MATVLEIFTTYGARERLNSEIWCKGDDILEGAVGNNYYTGGPGADNFKCSPGPGHVVEDYNPAGSDTICAACETV